VRGDTVVVQLPRAASGLIAVQWARHLGAEVIGVTGNDAKAQLARTHGATHTLILGRDDLPARVRELTRGRGADVVYDSVGKDTFTMSLDCLRPRGLMVSYGNSSGPCPVQPARVVAARLAVSDTTDAVSLHRDAAQSSIARPGNSSM
jgi:NADPH2:quinone reductase